MKRPRRCPGDRVVLTPSQVFDMFVPGIDPADRVELRWRGEPPDADVRHEEADMTYLPPDRPVHLQPGTYETPLGFVPLYGPTHPAIDLDRALCGEVRDPLSTAFEPMATTCPECRRRIRNQLEATRAAAGELLARLDRREELERLERAS